MVPPEEMPRSKTIKWQETKEGRKAERQKLGRLSDLRVSQGTRQRYAESLNEFNIFARISLEALLQRADLEAILVSYIEQLWEDGESKTSASYTVAALQFHEPSLKGHLAEAWKLLSLWNKLEQPKRATPLSSSLLLALAGTFLQWRWDRLAWLIIVGFCGLLRTGEMFLLRRCDVVLPKHPGQPAVLFLQDTKTAQRNHLLWEKVLIHETIGLTALRQLCQNRRGEEFLVDESAPFFRSLWKQVVCHLKLESLNFLPYSLRRGGATSCYEIDQLLEKGRWKHVATARCYLDQAMMELASLLIPPSARSPIRAAQLRFQAAVKGTRGKGG